MPLHDFHLTPSAGSDYRRLLRHQRQVSADYHNVPVYKAGVLSHVRTCTLRPAYKHVTLKIVRERERLRGKPIC